ncbi:unnamed protein product, partial [Rangifer tarandus platyrhynchus]
PPCPPGDGAWPRRQLSAHQAAKAPLPCPRFPHATTQVASTPSCIVWGGAGILQQGSAGFCHRAPPTCRPTHPEGRSLSPRTQPALPPRHHACTPITRTGQQ